VSKLDQRTFSLGTKPEIVIADRNGISVVSGGVSYRIALRANETSTKIVHETEKGDVTLAEGGAVEMARLYDQLSASLSGRQEDGLFSRKGLIAAAFVLGAVLGLAVNKDGQPRGVAEVGQQAAAGQQDAQGTGPDMAQMFQELMRRRAAGEQVHLPAPDGQMLPPPGAQRPEGQPAAPAGAPADLAKFAKGTAILPAPDFLKVPETLPPLPDVAAPPQPAEAEPAKAPAAAAPQQTQEPTKAPAKEAPKAAAAPAAAPTSSAAEALAAKIAEERIARATADLDTAVKEAVKAPAAAAPVSQAPEPAKAPAAAPAAAPVPAPAPTQESSKEVKPAADPAPQPERKPAAAPEKTIDHGAIKSAIDGMVRSGMSTEDQARLMAQLQQLGGDTGEITPQMLRALPHEVARILVESGVVDQADLDGPGGVPYRIIRLPDTVMERYRGKDGIASIPERDSWVSTGNSVKLPLPGGGDIKSPDDIKSFGLTP